MAHGRGADHCRACRGLRSARPVGDDPTRRQCEGRAMTGLREKVALVTGSSRGIGAAIAKLFAREGAKVAVHGRAAPALSATRDEIERAGGRAISVAAD